VKSGAHDGRQAAVLTPAENRNLQRERYIAHPQRGDPSPKWGAAPPGWGATRPHWGDPSPKWGTAPPEWGATPPPLGRPFPQLGKPPFPIGETPFPKSGEPPPEWGEYRPIWGELRPIDPSRCGGLLARFQSCRAARARFREGEIDCRDSRIVFRGRGERFRGVGE